MQVRSLSQLSIDGSNMFIRPLDTEIYANQILLTSAQVILIKEKFPKMENRGLFNSERGDPCASKNQKISKYLFFPRWKASVPALKCENNSSAECEI